MPARKQQYNQSQVKPPEGMDSWLEVSFQKTLPPSTVRLQSKKRPGTFVVTISRNYNPDFAIPCNDGMIYVEVKGKFSYRDRETITNLTDIERNSLILAVHDYTRSYQGVSNNFTIKDWGKRYGVGVIDKTDNSALIQKIKSYGGLKV